MSDKQHECPVRITLDVLAGKWKPLILYHLTQKTKRFGELKQQLPNVTQRMLTLQLRELEHDLLIRRVVYTEVPPKVEYSLTELGASLVPILLQMRDWGDWYVKLQAREAVKTAK
jgi:DNA-binding HxlR family transcriptional regulator